MIRPAHFRLRTEQRFREGGMEREQPKKHNDGQPLVNSALTGTVIAAFYETYNVLDYGFLEAVYRSALTNELRARGLHVQCEAPIAVFYKGRRVGWYRLDLLVEQRLAVEVKAGASPGPTDRKQLLNYLRATDLDIGLLLHYGPTPEFHRCASPRLIASQRRP